MSFYALRNILTAGDCAVAHELGIRPILQHYEFLCQKLFKGILDNPSHKLKALPPQIHEPSYKLKNKRYYKMPRLRTSKTMNTFIFAMARKFNGLIFMDMMSILLLLWRAIIIIIIIIIIIMMMIMMIFCNQFTFIVNIFYLVIIKL